jgi:hypothetical protein
MKRWVKSVSGKSCIVWVSELMTKKLQQNIKRVFRSPWAQYATRRQVSYEQTRIVPSQMEHPRPGDL